MTTKHEIEEEIHTSPFRILLPVARANTLRRGVFQEIVNHSRTPRLYVEMAQKWEEKLNGQAQKDEIFAKQGLLWGMSPKNLVIIPVKDKPLDMPTVPIVAIYPKVLAACKRYGCSDLAVAKHLWRNQRYSIAEVQELIDGLEKGGVTVHEYE